jgi:protoheme IX farnesyltransferase
MVSIIGGFAMIALSVQVLRLRTGEPAIRAAQHLFGFSILYLFSLFAALLAEHGLGLMRPLGWHV